MHLCWWRGHGGVEVVDRWWVDVTAAVAAAWWWGVAVVMMEMEDDDGGEGDIPELVDRCCYTATLLNVDLPTDPLMPDLEDTADLRDTRISSGAYDDEVEGKHGIGIKWAYRNKKDERWIVVRNKARLVAQGYTQEEGIDYDKVFASFAKIEAIRLFLAYASFMGFIMYQMDVKSVFLYGTIEEEVYV
uniref:Copia protein n=1 Tax=Tanacetum cinerariifolium TaxID=118510 RepID=A0A6L2KDN0_TANCI|nr:copia protein [Tanacetum cinerariifolium]